MIHGKCVKKIHNIIAVKLRIESNVKIDRFHRIGPCKTKTGQGWGHPWSDLTDLKICKVFEIL